MKRVQVLNAGAATAALIASVAIMGWGRQASHSAATPSGADRGVQLTTLADGQRALIDATGRAIPLRNYRRIVAGSIVARAVLGELCDKRRIVGVIAAGIDDAPDKHRFTGIPRLQDMKSAERLLSLRADLVIINSLGSLSHVQRLRDAGLQVFALGDMRGVDTFIRDVHQVAELIGQPKRGRRLATGFRRRITAVAKALGSRRKKTGMYLSAYGPQMFGGTVGTSYHDVLSYAGVDDAAAGKFRGWPQYTAEHVLSIDPEVIVGPRGIGAKVCGRGSLARLRACQNNRSGFVELASSWLEDPSTVMLDVVETIHEAVYGTP